ncbi:unnamed protein product [Trifolium pratense]|uniref:Uncharacterized protein n=1 Tax=Trifolium pratense TaxID=57577 RepID=A0ACB0JLY2_TRIPR|nr:unnamed protein product [Trifolium pratense]
MILLMLLLFLVVLMLLFLLNDESYRGRDEGEIRKEFIIIFLIFSLFNNKNDMCKLKKIKKKLNVTYACHLIKNKDFMSSCQAGGKKRES